MENLYKLENVTFLSSFLTLLASKARPAEIQRKIKKKSEISKWLKMLKMCQNYLRLKYDWVETPKNLKRGCLWPPQAIKQWISILKRKLQRCTPKVPYFGLTCQLLVIFSTCSKCFHTAKIVVRDPNQSQV